MDDQSLPLQIGVPLDESSLLFFGCLTGAIGLVYLTCRKKFGERSVTGSDDYIYQFLPRQLATREEYSKGFLTYFGTMALTVQLRRRAARNRVCSGDGLAECAGPAADRAVSAPIRA
jgi:hypothetical protein